MTVIPAQTAGDARQLMLERGFRQVPVVEEGELVEIVSDRDIRSCVGGDLGIGTDGREADLGTSIEALMTREIITLSPDDSLRKAFEVFIDAKVGGIPVVDQAARLLGIVTYVNLLRCFLKRFEED